ncbi:MAG TPA: ADOP family duplicated permease [Bryobacteraceae bacterium]|nr:ADOP family duplicated permease [Bryobacteraceae bacterium]
MPEHPPQLAERLLRWLVGGRDADAVTGDLRESFQTRGGGAIWYWRQALSCAAVRLSPHRRVLPGLGHDFHHALRTIRRNPGYAFTAMVCLALAMGVNTTLFSFLDSLYFRKLPVPEPEQIFQVIRHGTPLCSWREYMNFRDGLRSFRAAASLSAGTYVEIDRQTVNLSFEVVSANYADVLRLGTTLGRWFAPDEDSPGSEPAVVISHQLWSTRFHSDPAVVGRQLRIHDLMYRVVGIGPADFVGDRPPIGVDLWITESSIQSTFMARGDADGPRVSLIGRLSPHATFENALAEVRVIDAAFTAGDAHDPRASDPALVEPASGFLWVSGRQYMKPVVSSMSLVCGIVLLIACVNVANLLLSRAAVRRREMAVRQSLGASRARLFRQTLVEGMVLAAGGVALGIVAGWWIGRVIESLLPAVSTQAYVGLKFDIDWRVALFVCALGSASAILFSLPPALEAGRDLSPALKGADSRQRSRQREIYSLAQVALSLTLLIATSLLIRALLHQQNIDPGYATAHRLYVNLWASPKLFQPEESAALFTNLLQQARQLPGVREATIASSLLGSEVTSACASADASAKPRKLNSNVVEPNFFDLMQVAIVRGRAFGPAGTLGEPPAVVVNQTMARTWWPGEDPLGKPVWLGCGPAARRLGTVIGVAKDVKYQDLNEAPTPFFYLSRRQDAGTGFFELIVRTEGDPYLWSKPLLAVAQSGGPKLHIFELRTPQDAIAFDLRGLRWQTELMGSLGFLAIVLAVIGLYGVVAYSVSQRTREIGMRMALGATSGDVLWLVLGRGLRITAGGVAFGLLLSAVAVHWLRSYLYGLSPFDPIAFSAASLAWLAIAMLASWYPARRATRVDPITALKYE